MNGVRTKGSEHATESKQDGTGPAVCHSTRMSWVQILFGLGGAVHIYIYLNDSAHNNTL